MACDAVLCSRGAISNITRMRDARVRARVCARVCARACMHVRVRVRACVCACTHKTPPVKKKRPSFLERTPKLLLGKPKKVSPYFKKRNLYRVELIRVAILSISF
jgi:hypothetical protein